MHIVDHIFVALGESTAISKETGFPVQTVYSWKKKGDIPHWRRPSIIAAARKLRVELPPEALAYLASGKPSKRAAA